MSVIGVLVMMLCRARCSASNVAAELTFFPPTPPCYTLERDGEDEELQLMLAEFLEAEDYAPAKVALVPTRRKGKVAVVMYSPPPGIPPKFTMIYSHGNAADIGSMHDRCVGLCKQLNVFVVVYDYTGYGASCGGKPSEANTYSDIEAVCDWARRECPGTRLILYGQSVGSGPSCYLASLSPQGDDCAGLVLHSPIMSGMRVLTSSRALACLDIYPNIDRIAQVRCPVYVIHGTKDAEVPLLHGKSIQEAVPLNCKRAPWWVPGRGHNDICERHSELREYYKRLKGFVASLPSSDSAPRDKMGALEMTSSRSTDTERM